MFYGKACKYKMSHVTSHKICLLQQVVVAHLSGKIFL